MNEDCSSPGRVLHAQRRRAREARHPWPNFALVYCPFCEQRLVLQLALWMRANSVVHMGHYEPTFWWLLKMGVNYG